MTHLTRVVRTGRWLAIAIAIFTVTACGGGGGSSSAGTSLQSTPPSSSPPVTSQAPDPAPAPTIGAATLSWTAPDQNTDGSALTNLAGYRIYYGNSANTLDQVINVPTVGVTEYVVDNLTSGTYYFSIRAYTSAGTESALSNVVSDTIG